MKSKTEYLFKKILESYNEESWSGENDDFELNIRKNMNDYISGFRLFYLPYDDEEFNHFVGQVGSMVTTGIDNAIYKNISPRPYCGNVILPKQDYGETDFVDDFKVKRNKFGFPIIEKFHGLSYPDILYQDCPKTAGQPGKAYKRIDMSAGDYSIILYYTYPLFQTSKFINNLENVKTYYTDVRFLHYGGNRANNKNIKLFNDNPGLWNNIITNIRTTFSIANYKEIGIIRSRVYDEQYFMKSDDLRKVFAFRYTTKNNGRGDSYKNPTGYMSIIFYYLEDSE